MNNERDITMNTQPYAEDLGVPNDALNDKDIAMNPHERRVVQEKRELYERATKLSEFIATSSVFPTLPADEQERLREQCEIMWQYSEILGKRIAAFPV